MKPENAYTTGIFTVGMLFFICGFTTWLNAVLIPYLKVACELNNFQAYFVTLVFYLACAAVIFPTLRLLRQADHASVMVIGLMLVTAGALIFIPAALLRTYPLFLLSLLVAGAGVGLLHAAAGIGLSAYGGGGAMRRRTAMNACGKAAGALGLLAIGGVLFRNIDGLEASIRMAEGASRAAELDTLSHKIVLPCLAIALSLLAATFWVKFAPLPSVAAENSGARREEKAQRSGGPHLLRLWLGGLALFLYAGAEVVGIVSIALYGKSAGMSLEAAKALPACSLLAAILGCLLSAALVPKHICRERTLAVCAALGVIFSVAAVSAPGWLSLAFVALLGMAAAPVWPFVFSLTAKAGRGDRASAAMLSAGALGGALLPLAYGYLADAVGARQAYWILAPCYAFILLYAVANLPSAGEAKAKK